MVTSVKWSHQPLIGLEKGSKTLLQCSASSCPVKSTLYPTGNRLPMPHSRSVDKKTSPPPRATQHHLPNTVTPWAATVPGGRVSMLCAFSSPLLWWRSFFLIGSISFQSSWRNKDSRWLDRFLAHLHPSFHTHWSADMRAPWGHGHEWESSSQTCTGVETPRTEHGHDLSKKGSASPSPFSIPIANPGGKNTLETGLWGCVRTGKRDGKGEEPEHSVGVPSTPLRSG